MTREEMVTAAMREAVKHMPIIYPPGSSRTEILVTVVAVDVFIDEIDRLAEEPAG